MSRTLFSLLILVLVANSALSELTERVVLNNVNLIPVGDNQYNLKIFHKDGRTLEVNVLRAATGQYELQAKVYNNLLAFRTFFPQRQVVVVPPPYGYGYPYGYPYGLPGHNVLYDSPPADTPQNDAAESASRADTPQSDAPKYRTFFPERQVIVVPHGSQVLYDSPPADAPQNDAAEAASQADTPQSDAAKDILNK